MNYERVKRLRERRYSEVGKQQQERNQKRVDHAGGLFSKLEEQVEEKKNERLQTAKELLSLAGAETRTSGCNVILTDCLELLRETAEQLGCNEVYEEQMERMPNKTVSKSHPDREPIKEKRRRRELSEGKDGDETDSNQRHLV